MGKLMKPVLVAYYPHGPASLSYLTPSSPLTHCSVTDLTSAFSANVQQMKRVLEAASPGATAELSAEVRRQFAEAGWEDLEGVDAMSQVGDLVFRSVIPS